MEIDKETPVGVPQGASGVLKVCRGCCVGKPLGSFTGHPNTRDRLQPQCRTCVALRSLVAKDPRAVAAAARYRSAPRERKLWLRASGRASASGREFTIELSDITIPALCPVFGIPFGPVGSPYAPSLDRRDSTKGYTPENIVVISTRANLLKKDATADEIAKLHEFMQR